MSSAKEEERKYSESIREKDRRVKEFERRFVRVSFLSIVSSAVRLGQ